MLVVAPHPDDEILGVGGTIWLHSEKGDEIHLCIVTQAYAPDWPENIIKEKQVEAIEASKLLGVDNVDFPGYPTVKLNSIPTKNLKYSISRIIDRVDPDVVYSPYPEDLNIDHGVVAGSVAVCAKPTPDKKRILL